MIAHTSPGANACNLNLLSLTFTALLAAACTGGLLLLLFRGRYRSSQKILMDKYAYRDPLTGLLNRECLKTAYKKLDLGLDKYALILLRIKDFDRITSIFGYAVGSKLIKDYAAILSGFVREGEQAFHLTGDHFVLLLKYAELVNLTERANSVFHLLDGCSLADETVIYSYSPFLAGGVCLIQTPKKELGSLLMNAKFTADKVTADGRYRWLYFDESIENEIALAQKLEEDVLQALEKKEFVPYFLPQYNVSTGEIVGAEVLARWKHPTLGILSPSAFIPILENAGTILELDLIMLEEACIRIRSWLDEDLLPVPLSVNISRLNIYRQDLIPRLTGIVNKYRIPATLLDLEFDVTTVYENGRRMVELTNQLRRLGFHLTMDNFAFSAIPLDTLSNIALGSVKSERRLLSSIKNTGTERIILTYMIKMLHEIGIKLVVTGMDSKEQLAFILEMGCTMAQGRYFSIPVDGDEFEKMVFE